MRLNKWLRRSAIAGGCLAALAGLSWVAFESLDRPFRRRCPQSLPFPRKS